MLKEVLNSLYVINSCFDDNIKDLYIKLMRIVTQLRIFIIMKKKSYTNAFTKNTKS